VRAVPPWRDWRSLLRGLKERRLPGAEFVVSDGHEGLKQAIGEMLPQATPRRGYVRFLRNARDYLPRKALGTTLLAYSVQPDTRSQRHWRVRQGIAAQAEADTT
jgi:transposase-like protein